MDKNTEKNKPIFEGVDGVGMPSPAEQFENATGLKFNEEEYEILWSGAEGDEYVDSPAVPFSIVKKQNQEKDLAAQIAEKEAELKASAERRTEYRSVGATEQLAYENSNYAKIVEEIAELKAKQESSDKSEEVKTEVKEAETEVQETETTEEIEETPQLKDNLQATINQIEEEERRIAEEINRIREEMQASENNKEALLRRINSLELEQEHLRIHKENIEAQLKEESEKESEIARSEEAAQTSTQDQEIKEESEQETETTKTEETAQNQESSEVNFVDFLNGYNNVLKDIKRFEEESKTTDERLAEINKKAESAREKLAAARTPEERAAALKELNDINARKLTDELEGRRSEIDSSVESNKKEAEERRKALSRIKENAENYYKEQKTALENKIARVENNIKTLESFKVKDPATRVALEKYREQLEQYQKDLNTLNAHKRIFDLGIKKLDKSDDVDLSEYINRLNRRYDNYKEKTTNNKTTDDKTSDDKKSDDKTSDDKKSDDKTSDDKKSDDKTTDDKTSDDNNNGIVTPVGKTTENKDEEKEDKEDKEDKEEQRKLDIIYSGRDNKYIVRDNKADSKHRRAEYNAEKFKNQKEKIAYLRKTLGTTKLKEIFGADYAKNMKKMMKKCDAQLLTILAAKDMQYAKEYISALSSGKESKSKLPYTMTYNLQGMKKNRRNNKLGFIQRIKNNLLAKRNKNVAEYIPDTKNRGWLAIPIIGALAAGAFAAHTTDRDNEKNEPTEPTISDTTEPSKEDKTQDPIGPDPVIIDAEQETTEPEQDPTEPEYQTPTGDIITQSDIEDAVDNAIHKMTIGDQVHLTDGIKFTEDSWGNGRQGKTGITTGNDFVINQVCLQHGDKFKAVNTEGTTIEEAAEKYAKQLGVDPSEIITVYSIKDNTTLENSDSTGWVIDDVDWESCVTYAFGEPEQENTEPSQETKKEKSQGQKPQRKQTPKAGHEDR